jgi:hypothetical protein
MLAQGLDKQTIATRMASIASLYAEAGAESVNTATKTSGLGVLWAKVKAGYMSAAATVTQTLATWGLVPAEVSATVAAGIFAVVILIVVAAIALLVIGIIALVKWFQKMQANTPEGKLKTAKETAEAAAEAADAAADAYNNLSDAFDSLSDKYSALEELTRGSREWRDAVREINNEVLDLVDQYPELADLVENDNGVLKIDLDSKEAQDVLNKYEDIATKASTAEIAAKIDVAKAEDAVAKKNLSKDAQVGREGIGWKTAGAVASTVLGTILAPFTAGGSLALMATAGGLAGSIAEQERQSAEDTDKMAEILANGWLVEGEDGWKVKNAEAIEALGLTADQAVEFANSLGEGVDELREYGLQLD